MRGDAMVDPCPVALQADTTKTSAVMIPGTDLLVIRITDDNGLELPHRIGSDDFFALW